MRPLDERAAAAEEEEEEEPVVDWAALCGEGMGAGQLAKTTAIKNIIEALGGPSDGPKFKQIRKALKFVNTSGS